jgi:hypothetical protein
MSRQPLDSMSSPGPLRSALRLLAALPLAALAACAAPTYVAPANANLPAQLQTGPSQLLDQVLTARGQTIYECRRDGAVQLWTLEGDLATLVDAERRSVGTVTPGDYFTAYDGSYVIARPDGVAQVTAGTRVWARLIPRQRAGHIAVAGTGRFARASVVQRVDTTGGLPPDPLCEREGGTLFVPYSATYLIYTSTMGVKHGNPSAPPANSSSLRTRPKSGITPLPTD